MNINNSSDTVVIDPKSQAAIDAVRDRITLIESENVRLTKLKNTLEAEVRTTDNALEYKKELLAGTEGALTITQTELEAALIELDSVRNLVEEYNSEYQTKVKDLDEQATALTLREKKIQEMDAHLGDTQIKIMVASNALGEEKIEVERKKAAIAELLTKL